MAKIEITIPDAKTAEFYEAFFMQYNKPTTFTGSDLEWVKQWVIDQLLWAYTQGREKMRDNSGLLS